MDKAIHRERMAPESVASWRMRRLVVVDTSFGDIVEALGRYLPGAIFVGHKSLNRQAITGVFDLTQPVEALRTLAASQNASVTEVTPYLLVVLRR
jgi:transmembrane sensor